MAVAEARESLGLFPDLLKSSDATLDNYYSQSRTGRDRMAGFETDVGTAGARIVCATAIIWIERRTSLILRLPDLGFTGTNFGAGVSPSCNWMLRCPATVAAFGVPRATASSARTCRKPRLGRGRVVRAQVDRIQTSENWFLRRQQNVPGEGCHGPAMPVWRWGPRYRCLHEPCLILRHLRERMVTGGATCSLSTRPSRTGGLPPWVGGNFGGLCELRYGTQTADRRFLFGP